MFDVRRRVGRVVEARVYKLAKTSDVDDYSAAFAPVTRLPPGPPVLCADHRPVVIYSQPVTDKLVELFTALNTIWSRVAIVVAPSNATLAMQLQRVVKESKNPSRRVFFDAAEASSFLGEILERDEAAHVARFLAEGAVTPISDRPSR